MDWLSFPSFLVLLAAIFWSPVLGSQTGRLKVTFITEQAARARVVQTGARGLERRPRMMYLPNHRSFADFFLDQWITEGRAATLSRLAVGGVFPLVMASLVAVRSIILFQRGGRRVRAKESFNAWLDDKLAKSSQKSFLIYPEGHRSTKGQSLPLKTGMLKYAFSRRMPVQTIISANKEAVMDEKALSAHFGQTVVVGFSEVIDPADFGSFEDFMAKVQSTWDAEWERVLAADPAGKREELRCPLPRCHAPFQRLREDLTILASMLLFVLVVCAAVAGAVLLAKRNAVLLGVLATLLGAWLCASIYACSKPCDARGRMRAEAPPPVAGASPEATGARPTAERKDA
eukprot:scaffold3.g6361.t1